VLITVDLVFAAGVFTIPPFSTPMGKRARIQDVGPRVFATFPQGKGSTVPKLSPKGGHEVAARSVFPRILLIPDKCNHIYGVIIQDEAPSGGL